MFDFLENDYFIIVLEIVFAYFIITDTKKYLATKKKEFLIGAILSLGFFIYALIPFYNKYNNWEETQKMEVVNICKQKAYDNNISKENVENFCECYSDKIFKEYSYQKFNLLNIQREKELFEFQEESIKDCKDK